MDRFCGYLEKCGLLFHVTHSFRTVDAIIIGAIVDPSKLSNHYIARGLDGNFIVGSEFYNSTRLKALIKINQLPKAILSFLSLIRKDKRLRWGGDFLTPDVVHFDDETNRKEPKLYKQILKLINPKK